MHEVVAAEIGGLRGQRMPALNSQEQEGNDPR
jgi:hypothetical protein